MAKPSNPSLDVEWWPTERPQPYPGNPRVHDGASVAKIARSLTEYGWRQPVVVDENDVVIMGHGRLLAARKLGMTTVPVHVAAGLPAAKVKALRLADNRTQQESSWAYELLGEELAGLKALGYDPSLAGFEADEYAPPDDDAPGAGDTAPQRAVKAVTRPGDLISLGPHRLACGSATDAKAVERLLGSRDVACVWTDPPYGVSYDSDGHRAIEGDDLRHDDLAALLEPALRLALGHAAPSAAFYVWHASATREDFAFALKAAGLEERQYLIWAKPAPVLGWGDYLWQHEPCFYACRAGSSPAFYGDRTQSTVWEFATSTGGVAISLANGLVLTDGHGHTLFVSEHPPKRKLRHVRVTERDVASLFAGDSDTDLWRVSKDEAHPRHPTQKPVALVTRALRNSTRPGEWVYDPFAGSGTALVGAERLGRKCAAMELDPLYCDVAIERWLAESGASTNGVKVEHA